VKTRAEAAATASELTVIQPTFLLHFLSFCARTLVQQQQQAASKQATCFVDLKVVCCSYTKSFKSVNALFWFPENREHFKTVT